jgi:hypothetical protein
MEHVTDPSAIRVEADILQAGPSQALGVRLRRLVEPALFVLGAGAILLAVQTTTDDGSSPAGSASAVPSAAVTAPVAPPPLVAPVAAAPGERITVLGFRNGRLCGPAQLRFDGVPVAHRLAAYAGPLNLDHMQVFLTMRVPRSATPGSHEIHLYGPLPGGRRGPVCANIREHQGELATTAITVLPPDGTRRPALSGAR